MYKEVYHLLIIQNINLCYGKKERTSVYAKIRAEFPFSYLFDKLPDTFHGNVMIHRLSFYQKENIIKRLPVKDNYRFQFYNSVQDLNLTNLTIQSSLEGYEVIFFYDENRSGQPLRRGHNKDYHNINSLLYRHDVLNETAFFLKKEQYGRIVWNERKIDYDTGEWYYQHHIINLLHYSGKTPEIDIFIKRRPDFEYKQIAVLY